MPPFNVDDLAKYAALTAPEMKHLGAHAQIAQASDSLETHPLFSDLFSLESAKAMVPPVGQAILSGVLTSVVTHDPIVGGTIALGTAVYTVLSPRSRNDTSIA